MDESKNKPTMLNNRPTYLGGKCLIASPNMMDARFEKAVIFICAHSAEGALGFVINKDIPKVDFNLLLEQLELPKSEKKYPIRFGGPVETGRGFIIHSTDYTKSGTLIINHQFAMTATLEIMKDIAQGNGPEFSAICLGYTGWSAEQLEGEIKGDSWLICPADSELVFGSDFDGKWEYALKKIGVDKVNLSIQAGNA
jgi:putative transcriptional regulator